jgi:hypothetical protein
MPHAPALDTGRPVPVLVQSPISPTNWRSYVRRLVGSKGEKVIETLVDLMEGRPWVPVTLDGRMMEPLVPTAEIRLRAAIHLSEMMHGKAVSQTEQVEAEDEATELESIRALSDEELERRARTALQRGLDAIEARKPQDLLTDATVIPSTLLEWGRAIGAANRGDDSQAGDEE